jgi:hypothetical protein
MAMMFMGAGKSPTASMTSGLMAVSIASMSVTQLGCARDGAHAQDACRAPGVPALPRMTAGPGPRRRRRRAARPFDSGLGGNLERAAPPAAESLRGLQDGGDRPAEVCSASANRLLARRVCRRVPEQGQRAVRHEGLLAPEMFLGGGPVDLSADGVLETGGMTGGQPGSLSGLDVPLAQHPTAPTLSFVLSEGGSLTSQMPAVPASE